MFKLIRFNPRRASRNAPAAEVEINDLDNVVRLWMTPNDIHKNLVLFADAPAEDLKGLRDALEAYKRPWQEVREQ